MNVHGQHLPSSDTAVCRKRPCKLNRDDYSAAALAITFPGMQSGMPHKQTSIACSVPPVQEQSPKGMCKHGAHTLTAFRLGVVAFQVIVVSSSTYSNKLMAGMNHTSSD